MGTTEAVDDIPILVASAELLDRHFGVDSKWQGLRLGEMLEGSPSHILSGSDHRLNQVEEWAVQRLGTLGGSLGWKCEPWSSAMIGWRGSWSC